MLAAFRRFLATWYARAFFIVLVGALALFGVSGVVRDGGGGGDRTLAQVGTQRITPAEFDDQYRAALAQVSQMLGGRTDPAPAIRRAVAGQTLERLIVRAAVDEKAAELGISTPLDDVKRAVYAIKAFEGRNGAFDLTRFNDAMRSKGWSEAHFLDLMRSDLVRAQLLDAVAAGAAAPDALTRLVFAYQHETRVAEYVELPFAAAPEPPAPAADDLQRYYENNPALFSAPEFRRIKAVVLSPETIARSTDVPEEEVKAYYDGHQAEFVTPEKRSVRIVVAAEEAKARALADAWRAGASWEEVQKQAEPGASAIAFDDAVLTEIPSPELGAAVFAAAPDTVTGPIASPLGWQVFQVSKVSPGATTSLTDATPAIHAKLAQERAADSIYDRVNRLEDAVAASPTLEEIPTDLGAAALAGSLDRQGNTPEGEPAPLPGPPALRQAILIAAFSLAKGEPPVLNEGPGGSYFAVLVEDTTPAVLKPFDTVQDAVRQAWERDARRKAQEVVAARLLTAATSGGSLDDAAVVAGQRVQRTPPLPRAAPNAPPAPGVAPELTEAVFKLKLHEVTMIELPDAFLVAAPAEVSDPDMAADPVDAAQARKSMSDAMALDMQALYATALRRGLRPTVNQRVLDGIVQPPS